MTEKLRGFKWTPTAIECYERGGVCLNCPIQQYIESGKCQMKYRVIEIVKLFGKPNKTHK